MKHVLIATLCFLTACEGIAVNPAFRDVQRLPPQMSEQTARYVIEHERPLAEWIVETRRKCERFGCAE